MKAGPLADPCDRDYSQPFEVRKWMRQLDHHPITGFRYRPNLNLPTGELGFSFRSNSLGLRGPEAVRGKGVVFGTSFAQGYSVSEEDNWYNLCLRDEEWLNLGFPGAIPQWEHLANQYYEGPAGLAVMLYYPNVWVNSEGYYAWSESGKSFAEYRRWKDSALACWQLQRKREATMRRKLSSGQAVNFEEEGRRHFLEYQLCRYDWQKKTAVVERMKSSLRRMFKRFEKVALFYVPTKEEVAFSGRGIKEADATIESIRVGWDIFREAAGDRALSFDQHSFTISDYHSLDVHWNASGNRKMADWLKDSLSDYASILK